jgi:hypothetical protein
MARANLSRLERLALLAPLLVGTAELRAQDGEETIDRTPQTCITTTTIDRTKVIDDRTVLFYMRGKRVYLNYLPRKCPGLEREERFLYRSNGGRLCDIDSLTVLEQWGGRLSPGFTCQLGAFHPMSDEEAAALTRLGEAPRDVIEAEPVELPPSEDGQAAPGEQPVSPEADRSEEAPPAAVEPG